MHQTLLCPLLPLALLCCLGVGMPAAANPAAAADLDERVATGRALYLRQCASCHQRDGRGIEGQYPSLHDLAGPDDAAGAAAGDSAGLLGGWFRGLDGGVESSGSGRRGGGRR